MRSWSAMFNNGRRLIDFELDEERVVANVGARAKPLERQEARIAETDSGPGVRRPGRLPRRPLELLTAGTRDETLHDVLALLRVLVIEDDGNGQPERPVEQRVVVAGDDPDVDRQVRAFARAAAVRKQRRAKSISVRRRIERGAFDLVNRKKTRQRQLDISASQNKVSYI